MCGASGIDAPACVLVNTQSVVHLNTHTIHRFDRQEREHTASAAAELEKIREEHARGLRMANMKADLQRVACSLQIATCS